MEDLILKIAENLQKEPTKYQVYEDLYQVAREALKTDKKLGVKWLRWLSEKCAQIIPSLTRSDLALARSFFSLHKQILLAAAQEDFDSYAQYIEWNREPSRKFYPPRRKILKQVVDELQALADDELDLLGISLPPGVGKTTLAIFFLTWMAGKIPNQPMLTGSHSNSFVRGVYDECLRIFDANGEYLWHDVFPFINVCNTNAKDCRIDLGTPKRFETLEFTSIGTGNAGLYRAATLLYCDDLVSGIEVALSKERLDKLWQTYTIDLRQRKIGDKCKELHIATRWSVHDVIGRLESEYSNNPRAKFITIPALNSEDESNFDYAYGVGFSKVDGEFGKNTEKGVKAFQTAAKIEVDGKFGKKSMAALTAYSKPQDEPEKVEPEQPVITVPDETVYPIHGFIPDISVYQEAIDMDKFCAGNDFAILRARVNGKDDTKFAGWAVELKKRGFPFAVYDYLKLKSEADAVEQADAMYAACAPYDPKVYYLDTEELADGMTYEVERELIKVYVKRLREHGVKVIGQYTGDYRWRTSYREIESIFDTLWIASWGANEGTYTGWEIKSAVFTDKIHLHQYTSYGYTKVAGAPGINHRIDLNRLTGAVPLSWFTGRKYDGNTVEPTYPTYVVQSGDNLWKIAKNLLGEGGRWTEIAALNEIGSIIKVGVRPKKRRQSKPKQVK